MLAGKSEILRQWANLGIYDLGCWIGRLMEYNLQYINYALVSS